LSAPEQILTPYIKDGPCTGCDNEPLCAEGRACWAYVYFMKYGVTDEPDRRPSRTVFEKMIMGSDKNTINYWRRKTDDYEVKSK